MWTIRDSFVFDLTFAPRQATLLCVHPELESLGGGSEESQTAEYVRRAQNGDAEGYRQLFRLYVRRVHRLVHRLTGPGCDVEDVVQTIFVDAFRALPGFRGESAFFTWLARIAVRTTLRQARTARAHTVPLVDSMDLIEARDSATANSPENASDTRRALARLRDILASLSDKRRAAFVLHVLEGHSLQEVAQMLDARVSAIKVRIHDARGEIERQARRDPFLAHYLQWEPTP